MEANVRDFTRGAPRKLNDPEATPTFASVPELQGRVRELETENARLRLLVCEMLVRNQRLREENKALRGDQTAEIQNAEIRSAEIQAPSLDAQPRLRAS